MYLCSAPIRKREMNLLALRTKLAKDSGRYDLVVDALNADYSDNGMDYYINEGQKTLDGLISVPQTTATVYYNIAAGDYYLDFQHNCRVIETLFAEDDTSRTIVTQADLNNMKEYYNTPVVDLTPGRPLQFALANLRADETTDKDSLATYLDHTFAEDDTKYTYRGIVFGPPADKAYTLSLTGKFFQFILTSDSDENFWTQLHPNLLAKATLYHLDTFSTRPGRDNWLKSLKEDLAGGLEKDIAEEESVGVNQMRG